jgi:hypothetical protein
VVEILHGTPLPFTLMCWVCKLFVWLIWDIGVDQVCYISASTTITSH